MYLRLYGLDENVGSKKPHKTKTILDPPDPEKQAGSFGLSKCPSQQRPWHLPAPYPSAPPFHEVLADDFAFLVRLLVGLVVVTSPVAPTAVLEGMR
jgi:hypothetical protein